MQPSTRRSVVRGVAESQHQEDSFDMPSIESHAHAPSANPGPLKQLPSPLSPKLLNFVQELGHSPFSTVYHATVHGADVAVKMVSGPVSTEIMEVCNAFLNKTICHPNVVSVLGVHKVQERKTCNVDLSGLTRRICSKWHQPRKMSSRTMLHTAPELLKGEVAPGRATDVFALGVLLWELLTGKLHPPDRTREYILRGCRPSLPKTCPDGYARLITDCWHADHGKRPSVRDIVLRLQQMIKLAIRLPGPAGVWLGTSSSASEKIEAFKGEQNNSAWDYDYQKDMVCFYICGGSSSGDAGSRGSHSGEHLEQVPFDDRGPPVRASAGRRRTVTGSRGTINSSHQAQRREVMDRTPTPPPEQCCPADPHAIPLDPVCNRSPPLACRNANDGEGENARCGSLRQARAAQEVSVDDGDVASGTSTPHHSGHKPSTVAGSGRGRSGRLISGDKQSSLAGGRFRSRENSSSSGGGEDGALDATNGRDNLKENTSSCGSSNGTNGCFGSGGKSSSGGGSSGGGSVEGPRLPLASGEKSSSSCRSSRNGGSCARRRGEDLCADTRYGGGPDAGYTGNVCCFGTIRKRSTHRREV
eukprot:evm.model.scf_1183.4 EVM.evm.TU.scf_1183.4   scf_1183:44324-48230(+)